MLARRIGQTIEAARKRTAMTLDALAEGSSLDPKLISSVERGEQLVSTAKLDRIAAVLGLDAFALYEGRDQEQGLVVLPRYAARNDFRSEDLRVLRRALERGAALAEISDLLGVETLRRRFEPHAPGANPAEDGYHRARMVRKALERTTEPLEAGLEALLADRFNVPVLAEALLTASLQAATVRSSTTSAAAIVLNTAVAGGPAAGTEQARLVDRVSICHELCHVLFDEPREGSVDVVLDDAPVIGHQKPPIEQRAGAFAAEMLIPLHGLRKLLGDEGGQGADTLGKADRLIDDVRNYFATPAEIAVNHLYNHGYVARKQEFREELIKRAQQRERAPVALTTPNGASAWRQTLLARTREAHDTGVITDGAARALLGLEAGEELPWERDAP